MTSVGEADVTVDGSTAPWWTLMPKCWDEEAADSIVCRHSWLQLVWDL